jgi:hypothetical protein
LFEQAAVRVHWLTALRGMSREALIPTGGPTVPAPAETELPPAPAAVLRRLAGDDPTGLHLLLVAAVRLSLGRFGAAEDLAVLCPLPGATPREVVLRTALEPDLKISEFLSALYADLAEASALPWQDREALSGNSPSPGVMRGSSPPWTCWCGAG